MVKHTIFFILEDVLDTYNVGTFFRLAETVGVEKIYLCGQTETLPHPRISKAAKGTEKLVKWKYGKTAIGIIRKIREIARLRQGYGGQGEINIIAVEQHPKSIDYTKADYSFPLVLIFGNESRGIKQSTLKKVNQIVEIPMYGKHKSLNVLSAASIVSYWAIQSKPL